MAVKGHEQFSRKLGELRESLLKDPSLGELQRMQVQIDLLERAMGADLDFHHHDTNEHHDHVTLNELPGISERGLAQGG